jgi:polyphosphate glucokinase
MQEKILSVDIGGSHIKATLLNEEGELITDYQKMDTPDPANPENVLAIITSLANTLPGFDKVSAGFPGYIKNGIVLTAPNLGTDFWKGFALQDRLAEVTGKPAKLVNDADMQGLGVAAGRGFEIVATLGTGFGTAFLYDGKLLPHVELAHHPVSKDRTYDEYIGEKALDEEGADKWNKRVSKILAVIKTVFNYDHLYLGGGNAKKIDFSLDKNISIVTNKDGIRGGARLWQ